MRRSVGGKKRDGNEKAIVDALRGVGCEVHFVSGAGLPDLLVKVPGTGRWMPLEVKSAKGLLTDLQQGISWPVVRTIEEALAAVWR